MNRAGFFTSLLALIAGGYGALNRKASGGDAGNSVSLPGTPNPASVTRHTPLEDAPDEWRALVRETALQVRSLRDLS